MAGPGSSGRLKRIRVGIEHLPHGLFEHATDWSGLAITRLLAEPLFVELPNRQLGSRLIRECSRIDALTWKITINECAAWNTGLAVTSRDVCAQIDRARRASRPPACSAGMIETLSVVSKDTINIRTRIPIAHLDRVLANPGLAPRQENRGTTGPYAIERSAKSSLVLASIHDGTRIELVVERYSEEVDLFSLNKVDIDGPMSIPPSRWIEASRLTEATCCPLDIVYALALPPAVSPALKREIQSELDRAQICRSSKGSVVPRKRSSDTWLPVAQSETYSGIGHTEQQHLHQPTANLLYADFSGNKEIADATATQLFENWGIALRVSAIDYGDLSSATSVTDAYRIVLVASPWPHPAAMLAPYVHSVEAPASFRCLFAEAIADENLSEARTKAREAENHLRSAEPDLVILGQVMGCVRSRIGAVWCPPSAWIDYSTIHGSFT